MFFFFFFDVLKEKVCDSVCSFLKIISELPHKIKPEEINREYQLDTSDLNVFKRNVINKKTENTDIKYFYRGHYSTKYELLPSVYRTEHYGKEDYYFHQIKVECPGEFVGYGRLDQLVKMQHYDCPTRLLDVTSNPLIALYFACKNFSKANLNPNNKGVVYIFASNKDDLLFNDSDRALMLSCLSKFKTNEHLELYNECMDFLKKGDIIKHPRGSRLMKRFIQEIEMEKPSFKYAIEPVDLLKCFFVQPSKSNDRILKQDGAFIISGLNQDAIQLKTKIESMVYSKIIIENQNEILEELDKIGINEATLFPEIDKVANYLKSKKY